MILCDFDTEKEDFWKKGEVSREKFKDRKIAVRSSASCEDSILFKNSGQYDSFLNLTKDSDILKSILYYTSKL